jgi:hypothetical protein
MELPTLKRQYATIDLLSNSGDGDSYLHAACSRRLEAGIVNQQRHNPMSRR